MCGITGYIGSKDPLRNSLDNLKKLEYRGYDSAGVLFYGEGGFKLERAVGKFENLDKKVASMKGVGGYVAIAHTRWATHGEPSEKNAHPHFDCKKKIYAVHNGIIENYRELKTKLEKAGHKFKSETDTEVLPHLIEWYLNKGEKDFFTAFTKALTEIRGAYSFLVVNVLEPKRIYFAKLGSPLVIGTNKGEHLIASDPTALAGVAKQVMYLEEGQRGYCEAEECVVVPKKPKPEDLLLTLEEAKKGKYPHFMLKEINEVPNILKAGLLGRLKAQNGIVKLGGLDMIAKRLKGVKRLEIVACGTSYYASLIGELLIEEMTDLPVEVSIASEFRYKQNPLKRDTAYLFVSQSGETADTLAALRKVNEKKLLSLGLVNVIGSTIARETKAGVYNRAGAEIGVASTKAFLSQLSLFALVALYLAKNKNNENYKKLVKELEIIPEKIKKVLKKSEEIKKLAVKYQEYNNFLYLGRGYNYPLALEGALKIKEIGYVHAEGYAAGEMKHGPIAMVDPSFPIVAIITKNRLYEKMMSNLEEIKARGGKILAIATEGDKLIKKVANDVIYVPATLEQFEPMVNVIPLQLFAYHFAVLRGYDVDKPRNLAKSVTVE